MGTSKSHGVNKSHNLPLLPMPGVDLPSLLNGFYQIKSLDFLEASQALTSHCSCCIHPWVNLNFSCLLSLSPSTKIIVANAYGLILKHDFIFSTLYTPVLVYWECRQLVSNWNMRLFWSTGLIKTITGISISSYAPRGNHMGLINGNAIYVQYHILQFKWMRLVLWASKSTLYYSAIKRCSHKELFFF